MTLLLSFSISFEFTGKLSSYENLFHENLCPVLPYHLVVAVNDWGYPRLNWSYVGGRFIHIDNFIRIIKGFARSSCNSNSVDVNNFFALSNTSCQVLPHSHDFPFRTNLCKDSEIIDTVLKKLYKINIQKKTFNLVLFVGVGAFEIASSFSRMELKPDLLIL